MKRRSTVVDDGEIPTRDKSRPYTLEDMLPPVHQAWLASEFVHKADKRIPTETRWIIPWWIAHQAPADSRFERPHQRPVGSGHAWVVPYVDRLYCNLARFLHLDAGFQSLIIAAAEDRIWWEGDDRSFFLSVIAETEKLRKDPKAYREQAVKTARSFVRGFTKQEVTA